MNFIIGFLTVILVGNCLILMLLILLQLPKKEAGAGVAFGGGATDALFGAGSGSALTKMTKYSATIFLGLALLLSILYNHRVAQSNRGLDEALRNRENTPVASPAPAPATSNALHALPLLSSTNLISVKPTATTTNSAAPAKK